MITEDEARTIDEMAEMYRSEFGEDTRYNKVKAIIAQLEDSCETERK